DTDNEELFPMRLQDTPLASEHPAHEDILLETSKIYRLWLAYGRQIYRFRWLILVLWIIGLLVSLPFASNLPSVLKSGGYNFEGSESNDAYHLIVNKLHQPPSQLLVVFQSKTVSVNDPAYQREIHDFIARVQKFPHVTSAVQGSVGKDGRTTYVIANFNQEVEDVEDQLSAFRQLLPQGSLAGPAQGYVTGGAAVANEITQISQQDTEHADSFALPIALVVLLIVFGTVVAALMPLLLALVAVPTALAMVYGIALHNLTNSSVLSLASIIGLGISIDYSLFLIRRFREELARGRTVPDAVGWTIATAGEAILFSGMTVMIGFFGLLLIGIQSMTSLGIGGALVVVTSVLAALTLLPALLSVLGTRINSLRVPFLWRYTLSSATSVPDKDGSTGEFHGFWHTLALAVMRRPGMIILGVSVLLLALGWPVLSLNIGTSSDTALPQSSSVRQGLDILTAQFPDANANPVFIVAQTPDGSRMLTSANLDKVAHLSQWIATRPHVVSVLSLTNIPATPGAPTFSQQQLETLYSTGTYATIPGLKQLVSSTTVSDTTLITVKTDATIDSDAGKALIDQLRAGKSEGQGLKISVGGVQAFYLDFDRHLYENFPKAILFILGATYILLLLMFRSVLLPLKAILMNVLSVSATYGVLVYVFQWGNFKNILSFTSSGFIDSLIPILLFCVLFGLSMDYEVFLLSRIREEWLRTKDNTWAVARGLEQTGGVITSAALLFVIVTGAFTFTELLVTKEMGLGMTVAILVDATIIRSLLVPATMKLLGRWNWWLPWRGVR
ncbi:MAG: MMPL family transporter, partial [Chloroflexota bacterium]|nr:MMPL family transporter [Chloroflexota bacterium]